MNSYILIGGASTRMGRSKVDLFLARVVAAAAPVFDRVIAVQRAGGAAAGIIDTIYEEPHEHAAPVFGVACALRDAAGEAFVLGVDYPLVTSDVLRYIEGRFRASGASLVAPRWNGKVQMLCAAYAKRVAPRLDERIAAGRLDLRSLADDAEIIDEQELRARFEGEPLMNVNTPEDLQQAARYR